jgi:hypothetical protein
MKGEQNILMPLINFCAPAAEPEVIDSVLRPDTKGGLL